MLVPGWLEALQIKFMNPLMRPLAGRVPGIAVVIHRGRKSGTEYRTVVTPYIEGDVLATTLIHGKTNWVKNVLAAGEADVRLSGRDLHIVNPRIVPVGSDGAGLPRIPRRALAKVGVFAADIA